MCKEITQDNYKDIILEMVEEFKNDERDIEEFLIWQSRFHKYSAKNSMLIFRQNRYASFCASYKDFKKMGIPVKSGEQGIKILTPVKIKEFKKDGKWQRIYYAPKEVKEEIKQGAYETREKTQFIIGHVFDITQTIAAKEDIPKLIELGNENKNYKELFEMYAELIKSEGIEIEEMTSLVIRGEASLDTESNKKEIRISTMIDDTLKLGTLLHEYGHIILKHFDEMLDIKKEQKEAEADIFSILFENKHGLDQTKTRLDHLKGQFKSLEPVEIKNAFERAYKAFSNISKVFA